MINKKNKKAGVKIAITLILIAIILILIFLIRTRIIPASDFVESIYFTSKTGYVHNLAVKDNYAYLVSPRNFIVIDVLDKTNPRGVVSFPSDKNMIDIFIEQDYAYVGVGDMRFPNGQIKIYNISDPKNPKEIINNLILPETPLGIFVRDNIGYIGDFASGMIIVNFTDKKNPEILSQYEIAPAIDEAIYNEILNKAKTNYSEFKQDVLTKYSFTGMTANQFDSIVERMGLENFVKHLTILVQYRTEPHAWWLTVRGNYAYVALDASGMDIVEISDLRNPVKVGNFKKGEAGNEYFFNSIALSGDYAYAAVDAHGLLVIDISNPNNPREVADIPAWSNTKWLESGGHMVRSKIVGEILYLSATEDGLYIYNISNKYPVLIQKVDKSVEKGKGTAWALDVQEDYVYTAYFNTCANFDRCSAVNPKARYKPTGGFEIFEIK
jgi:hypothetical protein